MNLTETLIVFRRIKANWPRQPADDATMAEWSDCLRDVGSEAAMVAVTEWRNRGEPEPPAPGQLRKAAIDIEDEQRRRRRALNEPPPSEEERALVRALVRRTLESLEGPKVALAVEFPRRIPSVPREIEPDVRRAQDRIDVKRKKAVTKG